MIRGSCLCGAVRYEALGPFVEAHHCHCSKCRKQHGAAFATYAACKARSLKIEGGEHVAVFASTPEVRRSFCRTCGSSLFFAHEAAPKLVWVAAGTLDDRDAAEGALPVPDAHVFASSKARWWMIDDEHPAYEGQRPELGDAAPVAQAVEA
jgi:hypothetical protein